MSKRSHVMGNVSQLNRQPRGGNAPATNHRRMALGFAVASAVAALGGSVRGANYYWTGNSAGGASWSATAGGTNWSTSAVNIVDPGTTPGSADNVLFVFGGAKNFSATTLGQNFNISSLTFTPDANTPIGIGGANTLTIGTGGITGLSGSASATVSANLAVGASQTWIENPSTSTETIGGSFNPSDVISTIVNGVSVSYTVQSTDTNLAGVAIGVANAINSNASLAGLINATTNGSIVNVSGYQGVPALSSSVSAGASATTSTAGGAALTVSGILSGSGALTLQGTGSTQTPSGQFVLSGSNTYTGAATLLNANTSLTLNGNGKLLSATALTLGGGTVFSLDNTGTNITNRLSASLPVNSNGGSFNLLGSSTATSADQIGALNLNTGETNVNVIPGSGHTATLSVASLNRLSGAGVNFSATGSIALTSSTLSNGILGPWATIGALNNSGPLDYATVSGGKIVAYSGYDTTVTDLTNVNGTTTANIKLNTGPAVLAGNSTVNTLYLTGSAGIEINAAGVSTNTLTIGAGGIIANGGTASYSMSGNALINNATWIGGPGFSLTTATTSTDNQAGKIAVAAGVPDLVVTVPGTYNPVSGLINGALQLNVKDIVDTTTALGSNTAVTTVGSTTVALSTGTTAGLFPGVQVTGLTGTGLTGTTQYVVNVIDSTHFTIGNAPTASAGSASAIFVGHTGLTLNGGGLLDVADANETNKANGYHYQGDTTVNGGVLLVANDNNFGVAPTTFNPAAIVLNGGEIRSTAGLTLSANRGITVGPQGGTITYVGGSTLTLAGKITGPGGVTFNADSFGSALSYNIDNTVQDTYQGPTILEVKNSSTMTIQASNPLPSGTALTLALPPSYQSGAGAVASAVTGFGALDLGSGISLTVGSLASAVSVNNANITGQGAIVQSVTIGGTAVVPVTQSATFNGIISGNEVSVIKNGGGNETLTNANLYKLGTTINGGAIIAQNSSGSATGPGAVTVANGGTLGSGFNAITSTNSGIIGGAVTVQSGGTISPTVVGSTASTLQLNAGLNLSGGSILNYNLGAVNSAGGPQSTPSSDNVYVNGNLQMGTGTDTINISPITGFGAGTYPLITATGTIPASFSGINFSVNGPAADLYSVVDDTANNSLDLQVTVNPNPTLVWVGAPGNGQWDTNPANQPWANSGAAAYVNGAIVTFDDTPGTNAIITVPSAVSPSSVTFNNNGLVSYTFNGSGGIAGSTSVTKANVGTVTFNNPNTFTGNLLVNGGTVNIGPSGSLATNTISASAGTTFNVAGALSTGTNLTLNGSAGANFTSASQTMATISGSGNINLAPTALTLTGTSSTYTGHISGTGSLAVTGSGNVTLTGTHSYSGGTTIDAGVLTLSSATLSGVGTVNVQDGGTLAGTGSIAGPVVVSPAGTSGVGQIAPHTSSSTSGTLTINNNLTLNSGSVLNYNIAGLPANGDSIIVNGNLNFGGGAGTPITLDLSYPNGLVSGNYELIGYTGTVTGSPTFTVNASSALSFTVLNPGAAGNTFGKAYELEAAVLATTWTGATNGTWDVGTTANWNGTNGVNTGVTTYSNGLAVNFDDTGANTNITIATGGVSPNSVTFNNSSNSYSFSGAGINGAGPVTLNNTGMVTFTANNNYSGGTFLNAGTLSISADLQLGAVPVSPAANITLNGGTLSASARMTLSANRTISIGANGGTINVPATATTLTFNGLITGSGDLNVTGAATGPGGGSTLMQSPSGASNTYRNTNITNATMEFGTYPSAASTVTGGVVTSGLLGTGTITLNNNATLQFNNYNGNALENNLALNGNVTIAADVNGTQFDSNGLATPAAINLLSATTLNITVGQEGGRYSLLSFNNPIHGTAPFTIISDQIASSSQNPSGAVIYLNNSQSDYSGGTTIGNDGPGGFTATAGVASGATSTYTGGVLTRSAFGSGPLVLDGAILESQPYVLVNAYSLTIANAVTMGDAVNPNSTVTFTNNDTTTAFTFDSTGLTTRNVTTFVNNPAISVNPNVTVNFNDSYNAINGFTLSGSGTVFMNGAASNTTSGTIDVINTTLYFTGVGSTPANAILAVDGSMGIADVTAVAAPIVGGLSGTSGTVTIGSRTLTVNQVTNTTFAGTINGSGGIIKTGAGTLTMNTPQNYSGGTVVSGGGVLALAVPGALPNFSSLNISSGAMAMAVNHGSSPKNNLFVSSLTLSGNSITGWTGTLDLSNNDLVVQNGNLARIYTQVAQGYNRGAWNGSGGIISSAAAVDTSSLTALGVIQNSTTGTPTGPILYTSFDGATAAAATDVLVKFTYYGDTNLDGTVDGTDYARIDNGALTRATGWFNGDFNYDGIINGSDYTLIDNAYNSQGPQISAELASPTAEIAGGSGSSAVPEPTTLGLLGLSAIGLLGRRNRQRKI